MKHVRVNNANIEPVFFAYPDNEQLDALVARYTAEAPEYDYVAQGDGFRHQLWVIDDEADMAAITAAFAQMPALYIADGHHRSAAAALVGAEKARQNPNHRGDEEYNFFMAVCFFVLMLIFRSLAPLAIVQGLSVMSFIYSLDNMHYYYIGQPGETYDVIRFVLALIIEGIFLAAVIYASKKLYIKENNIVCPDCGKQNFTDIRKFNLTAGFPISTCIGFNIISDVFYLQSNIIRDFIYFHAFFTFIDKKRIVRQNFQ